MEYIRLGNSQLKVSRICIGCMGFGDKNLGMHSWTLGEKESIDIIRTCIDRGFNFFDTAQAYQGGSSERYLGKAIESINRDELIIATKFLPRSKEYIEKNISGEQYIEDMINNSLKNLQLDYVDLYIYHMWDYNTPIEEIMRGLSKVVKSGKARYIGISNCFAWQLAKANAIAEMENLEKFISVQNHYNLIYREEEREMLPYCAEESIAITPYSALASGRLSKTKKQSSKRLIEDKYAKFKYDLSKDKDEIIIDRVLELSNKRGVSMSEVSLAWLLSRVDSPIVGITNLNHLDAISNAVNLKLSDEELNYLEELYVPHDLSGVLAQNRIKLERK